MIRRHPTRGEIQPRWIFKTEGRNSLQSHRGQGTLPSSARMTATSGRSISKTGALLWKYATKAGIASSPVIDETNRLVMFGSEDNNFYGPSTTVADV